MRIAIILSLLIATLAIVFASINQITVDINFGFFTIHQASLPLVLISTLILGILAGYLMWLPARIAARNKIRALERAASGGATEVRTEPEQPAEPTTD